MENFKHSQKETECHNNPYHAATTVISLLILFTPPHSFIILKQILDECLLREESKSIFLQGVGHYLDLKEFTKQ